MVATTQACKSEMLFFQLHCDFNLVQSKLITVVNIHCKQRHFNVEAVRQSAFNFLRNDADLELLLQVQYHNSKNDL